MSLIRPSRALTQSMGWSIHEHVGAIEALKIAAGDSPTSQAVKEGSLKCGTFASISETKRRK